MKFLPYYLLSLQNMEIRAKFASLFAHFHAKYNKMEKSAHFQQKKMMFALFALLRAKFKKMSGEWLATLCGLSRVVRVLVMVGFKLELR